MIRVPPGVRIGFWKTKGHFKNAFQCKGIYTGPDLGEQIPGHKFEQELVEGTLIFRVGVLFRPDRNRAQRLETVLILEQFVPEMFEYESWEEVIN